MEVMVVVEEELVVAMIVRLLQLECISEHELEMAPISDLLGEENA